MRFSEPGLCQTSVVSRPTPYRLAGQKARRIVLSGRTLTGTKTIFEAGVARTLVFATFALLRTLGHARSHDCERGSHECARHIISRETLPISAMCEMPIQNRDSDGAGRTNSSLLLSLRPGHSRVSVVESGTEAWQSLIFCASSVDLEADEECCLALASRGVRHYVLAVAGVSPA